jgi:WD40 repeat protein/CHASE3 domain sensor protein
MTSLSIVLEFTRIAEPDDPHAFRFEPQGYTLRGPSGGRERFDVPWSPALLADIDALRGSKRDPAVIQRVGEVMHQALRPIGWVAIGEQIRAASEAGRPVVVTLRSNAAELYALPWELVVVGDSGQHLGELPGVLLRHEWPGTATSPEKPAPRPEGGRVLFAWSAAGGGVPAAEHKQALAAAWSEGQVFFDPDRDVLAHTSAASLADALAAAEAAGRPFSVLHLLAHGGAAGSTFGLALDGEVGAATLLDAGRLRQLLAPHAGSLRLVVLAACDGGNTGALGNHLGSLAQALHRAGLQAVLASRYPLSVAGSIVLAENFYRSLLVDLHPLERAFTIARAALARRSEHLDWASLQLYAREVDGDDTRPVVFCPYRGLLTFDDRHRRFFFGREAERDQTLGDLQALIDADKPRFLVVVGASGTGKSSMVLAGVVPEVARLAARRPGAWEVLKMTPGAAPVAVLQELLARRADGPLLLVVDQLEELFTHIPDPKTRQAFVQQLWSLARADTGVHVILTLRVDFLGDCGEILVDDSGLGLDRVAYDEKHRIFVARMTSEQVRRAVEAPAALVGLTFAPGLLDRILADVGDEPGALPLLQYALGRLWERRRGRALAAEVYQDLGGLVGALEKDADALIHGLADDLKSAARRLLTQLVDTREDEAVDTRRRVAIDQIAPRDGERRAAFDAVLTRLVAARLVVRGEKDGVPTLEVAHEALLRKWATLRQWIAEDRAKLIELDKLADWTRDWLENRTLLTGARLDRASELVRLHGDAVEEAARRLVQASEAQRRRRRNTVLAAFAVLVVAVLGMSGVSVYAVNQKSRAEEQERRAGELLEAYASQRDRAASERDRAHEAAWIAYARRFQDADPTRALLGLLSVRADTAPGWLQDALDTLPKPHARTVLRGGVAGFSPEGRRIVTGSEDGTVRVWQADGVGEPVVLRGHTGAVFAVGFDRDGQWLLTSARDRTARVWRADGSGQPVVLETDVAASFSPDGQRVLTGTMDGTTYVWSADGIGEPVALAGQSHLFIAPSFSPDGRFVLTASHDATARVWRADGAGEPVILKGHEAVVISASFSPDGRRVLTASPDGTARVWSATGSGKPIVLRGVDGNVKSASFSPDGRRVVTTGWNNTAWVWNTDGSGAPRLIQGHEWALQGASFSPDGRHIVTASDDKTARVWSVDGAGAPRVLRGHEGGVSSASFSPDGRLILTASEDDTSRVWSIEESVRPVFASDEDNLVAPLLDPDGRRVLTFAGDGVARVWNLDGGGGPVVLECDDPGSRYTPPSGSFSPDGRRVVIAGDAVACVWQVDGSGRPVRLRGHEEGVLSARFSPDGRRIVTTSDDHTARVWHADGSGEPVVLRHDERVPVASFSPDGRRIATGSDDRTARVWHADGSGEPVVLLDHDLSTSHALFISAVSFSPDGRHVVTASQDRTARVWSADGSGPPVLLRGHEEALTSASFSPDGRRVITTSLDKTARLWNADGSGEPVVLRDREHGVHAASFSPDGRRLFTASLRRVRVWTLDPALLRGEMEGASTFCIPVRERIALGEGADEACEAFAVCERKFSRSGECPAAEN